MGINPNTTMIAVKIIKIRDFIYLNQYINSQMKVDGKLQIPIVEF